MQVMHCKRMLMLVLWECPFFIIVSVPVCGANLIVVPVGTLSDEPSVFENVVPGCMPKPRLALPNNDVLPNVEVGCCAPKVLAWLVFDAPNRELG